MKPGERIPLHDHFDRNSGGKLAGSAVATVIDQGIPVTAAGATTFDTPALTLGTTNADGSASTAVRTDSTIAIFDSTTPLVDGTAATGSNAYAARSDHVHPLPGPPFTIIGQETWTSDGSATTHNLDNDFEANSVQVFNLTSGKALTVTEGTSPAITYGAAGTAGDILAAAYAASTYP